MAHSPTCSTPTEAGADERQGSDVDAVEVVPLARRRGGGAETPAGEQRGGDALGV